MRVSYLFLVISSAVFLCRAASLPSSHVVHERREAPPLQWAKRNRLAEDAVLPMRIGLAQSNLHRAYDLLLDVSDPASPNYGKHKTQEEVIELFKPSDEAVERVFKWLAASGIARDRITHSDNKGWLAFEATNKEAEGLLHTEYHEYEHVSSGHVVMSCDVYHVPKHIQKHIDYVTPGLRLLALGKGQKLSSKLTNRGSVAKPKFSIGNRPPKFNPIPNNPIHPAVISQSLSTCNQGITPACIAALYKVPVGTKNISGNEMGIFEFGDAFAQMDLNMFYSNYYPAAPRGFSPKLQLIDGGKAPVQQSQGGLESALDFESAIPLLYPQQTVLYQVGTSGGFNTFLDAIDGSYCTYSAYGETGNDPHLDPKYPDSTYNSTLMCGTYKATNVISISYGGQEGDLPAYYQRRQCNEFMKLGLQGRTILFASGDNGVAGPPGDYNPNGCMGNNATIFNPGWPNTCPFITNVGATKVMPGKQVTDPEWGVFDPAGHPYTTDFSSGGGFSNIFNRPNYQNTALSTYFTNHMPPYKWYTIPQQSIGGNGGRFNRFGRAYPDVAANGDNILVYSQGQLGAAGGTSASTPIFGAIINRINEERLAKGKKTVGFVNPTLYAHPEILNDIVNGTNPGCGTSGFTAVKGWDPVTGLGTPNFPKMLAFFMSLP